ncbi:MAG: DNA cytosine methyltransferase [Nitrospiraceae bacterium]
MCGGFPCQDISNAGKGVGIVGSRSGLWSEFARIIGEIRPRWVVAENVSALRGKGLVLVLQNLDALGYDAEWHCIPASAVGAPHQRDRIWIIAYTDRPGSSAGEAGGGGGSPVQNWQRNNPQSSTGRANVEPRVARERSVAYPDDDGSHRTRIPEVERKGVSLAAGRGWPSGGEALSVSDQWASEPDVGRVADGVPYRVDRLMSLGNAIVPEIMYQIGTRIREIHERS